MNFYNNYFAYVIIFIINNNKYARFCNERKGGYNLAGNTFLKYGGIINGSGLGYV
jgi:hypothetical protein